MMGMMPPGMGGKGGMPPVFVTGGAQFHPSMIVGMPPMGIPAFAKPPGTPPGTPPTPVVQKVASKAIKIVNPKTKQEVQIAKPVGESPKVETPSAAAVVASAAPAAPATPVAAVAPPIPAPAAPVAPKPTAPVPQPFNFAAMAAKPAPPPMAPPVVPKPAPVPTAPKPAASKPTIAPEPRKPSVADILKKSSEAPVVAPPKPPPPAAAPPPLPPVKAQPKATPEPPKHKAVEELAEAISGVSLSKSDSMDSDIGSESGFSESGSTFAGGERSRSVPPPITDFTLAPKPPGGKYDMKDMYAMRESPLSQTKPLNWEVPDDIDYWPVPGFICPPGIQSFGGGRGGGSGGRRGSGGNRAGPGGPGGPGGGYDAKKPDDKWSHRQLPAGEGGKGGRDGKRGGAGYNQSQYRIPAGDLPKLHKTDNKYVIGEVDDEEEKRQRSFKGILNKLTPDNFDKLLEKMLDIGITEAATLVGLIGQLFEKALQEPTFAALYAMFCQVLSERLLKDGVEFLDPSAPEGQQVITFRRVLLNKCQAEFESGDQAIAKAEAGEDDDEDDDEKKEDEDMEEGDNGEENKDEELEEGEVLVPKTEEELELEARRKEMRRQERLLQARRRMLGNIRFIGELFKKDMLTERIMHVCIQKLCGEEGKEPQEEDVEALCKLVGTIGQRLDTQKSKAHMDAYCRRMDAMSRNTESLSSRHRFMLQDVLDMRAKNWRERRKEEGPKKIEEVHRDAQRAAMEQTRRAGGGGGRPDRGPERPSTFSRDANRDPRDAIRGDSRRGSDSGFDRPQSRGARPESALPRSDSRGAFPPRRDSREDMKQPPSRQDSRESATAAHAIPQPRANMPAPPTEKKPEQASFGDKAFEEERKKIAEYFFDDKDIEEAVKSIAAWSSANIVGFVEYFLRTSFDRPARNMDWDSAYGLIRALAAKDGPLSGAQLIEGFMPLFNKIEDTLSDLPKAGDYIAASLAGSVIDGTVTLAEIAAALQKASPDGEEPGFCAAEGFALTLFATVLARAQDEDADKVSELYAASGVKLSDLRGDLDKDDSEIVPKLIAKLRLKAIA
jgi:translation initiation factor 4G